MSGAPQLVFLYYRLNDRIVILLLRDYLIASGLSLLFFLTLLMPFLQLSRSGAVREPFLWSGWGCIIIASDEQGRCLSLVVNMPFRTAVSCIRAAGVASSLGILVLAPSWRTRWGRHWWWLMLLPPCHSRGRLTPIPWLLPGPSHACSYFGEWNSGQKFYPPYFSKIPKV